MQVMDVAAAASLELPNTSPSLALQALHRFCISISRSLQPGHPRDAAVPDHLVGQAVSTRLTRAPRLSLACALCIQAVSLTYDISMILSMYLSVRYVLVHLHSSNAGHPRASLLHSSLAFCLTRLHVACSTGDQGGRRPTVNMVKLLSDSDGLMV